MNHMWQKQIVRSTECKEDAKALQVCKGIYQFLIMSPQQYWKECDNLECSCCCWDVDV